MKPTKCPAKEEKMKQEKLKRRGGEKVKGKSQDYYMSLLNPKTISKFCFMCKPELRKLIFCISREEYDL